MGGREVVGVLKGADPICNLLIDEAVEYLRNDVYSVSMEHKLELGLIQLRFDVLDDS
jgi:small nuclear ribonucleoprotein (snRNP)-like protein